MTNYRFITVRLGKDSIDEIGLIESCASGILFDRKTITVRCTQVPDNLSESDYAFIWLGSDNNKGAATSWKQGFKAMGIVRNVAKGEKYNDFSETTIEILYVFKSSISRLDFLKYSPTSYYWCSNMPLIGIDDHANQTIRSIGSTQLSDIHALFCSFDKISGSFKEDIIRINPNFKEYFSFTIPNPQKYPNANSLLDTVNHKMSHDSVTNHYLPYLTALRTKPFMLLAGISGTGKSRIVREMAFKTCPKYLQDKDGTTPGNYCMIEVKPNWHDSTELIGYYSNLSQSYQFKKFVKFLVKAKMNPEVPFFVCLDEMNLAPVEQYFAEILSILETRKHPKKDGIPDMSTIKTGVIVDSVYFDKITWKDEQGATHEKLITSDSDWYKAFFSVEKGSEEEAQVMKYQTSYTLREEGLKLPDNVFIIGTVNMDDTAHQFSRKVIDRAMTIEMNGGRLSDMYGGSSDLEYIEDEEVQRSWQQAFRQYYVTADEVLEEHPESAETLKKELPARLEEINKALKGTPFEVSYRVLNELTIMVGVMLDDKKEGEELEDIINRTVDNILLMKILPRIEGDADMFTITKTNEIPYNNRLEWLMAIAPDIKGNKTTEEEEGAISPEESSRSTAKDKIKEMIDRLNNQEFTRFWP